MIGLVARVVGAALPLVAVSACSEEGPAPRPAPPSSGTDAGEYDDSLEPAAAVLALVPEAATVLTVTDFEEVRAQLGSDGGADFWRRADREAPLLTRGMFRDAGGPLTQDDVLWEAHFGGGAGGYVVRFRDEAELARLPVPAGALVRPEDHLLVAGVAESPEQSWAADPEVVELVGTEAMATYVERGCVPGEPPTERLEPLPAFAVELGSTLATARLGAERTDLFTRMRLGARLPAFADGFARGAADPSSGRIGYQIVDPATAADLTLRRRLPFAVCGG